MKTPVEIISATECKTVNPLGKEPKKYSDLQCKMLNFDKPLESWVKWQQAENTREVYRIDNNINLLSNPPQSFYIIGSIHQAELNKETKTAIIH